MINNSDAVPARIGLLNR